MLITWMPFFSHFMNIITISNICETSFYLFFFFAAIPLFFVCHIKLQNIMFTRSFCRHKLYNFFIFRNTNKANADIIRAWCLFFNQNFVLVDFWNWTKSSLYEFIVHVEMLKMLKIGSEVIRNCQLFYIFEWAFFG